MSCTRYIEWQWPPHTKRIGVVGRRLGYVLSKRRHTNKLVTNEKHAVKFVISSLSTISLRVHNAQERHLRRTRSIEKHRYRIWSRIGAAAVGRRLMSPGWCSIYPWKPLPIRLRGSILHADIQKSNEYHCAHSADERCRRS